MVSLSTEAHRASCSAPDRDLSGFKGMSELSHACLCSLPFLKQSCSRPYWLQPSGSPTAGFCGLRSSPWPHSIYVLMSCSKQGRQLCCTANFLPYRLVRDSWVASPPVWWFLIEVSLCFSVSGVRCPVSLWPFQTTPVTQRDPVMQMKDVLVWPSQISHSLTLISSLWPGFQLRNAVINLE